LKLYKCAYFRVRKIKGGVKRMSRKADVQTCEPAKLQNSDMQTTSKTAELRYANKQKRKYAV